MKQVRFTKEGYEKLKKEYNDLLSERKLAVEDLQKARAMGDLSENGYYKAARFKLSSIDRNLRRSSSNLEKAIIISTTPVGFVSIGSRVTVSDGKTEVTYSVVGDIEADPSKKKISLLSPLGLAIAGKKTGDQVAIETPSGKITYNVVKVS